MQRRRPYQRAVVPSVRVHDGLENDVVFEADVKTDVVDCPFGPSVEFVLEHHEDVNVRFPVRVATSLGTVQNELDQTEVPGQDFLEPVKRRLLVWRQLNVHCHTAQSLPR